MAGLALTEYVIGVAVASLVMLVITSVTVHTGRTLASLANYSEMQATALNAIDQITKEVRQARAVSSYSTNQLTFLNATNASVTFSYSPTTRTLSRVQGASTKVLLTECESVKFYVYQRTPIMGTFDYNPIIATNEGKVVCITWACSRTLAGSKLNTESMQTARIVLRAN